MHAHLEWAQMNFGNCQLGDKRRTDRLVQVAADVGSNPSASFPDQMKTWGDLKSAYNLFDCEEVTFQAVAQPHWELCKQRQAGRYLVIGDTTELDLTRPTRQVRGTGPMDSDTRHGAFLHPLIAFDLDGVPLGTVWRKGWARPAIEKELTTEEKSEKRKETPMEEKESIRWVEGIRAARETATACPKTTCVCVGDSESDIYELFSESRETPTGNLELLVRACQIRATVDKSNFLEKVRAIPCLYTCSVDVSARRAKIAPAKQGKRQQTREARMAEVEIRATHVTLRPPYRFDRHLPPVAVNVVFVEEIHPPEGCEAIQWMLINTLPIDDPEQVRMIVKAYCVRWQIEVYQPDCTSSALLYRLTA